jgi:pimeloyl-ACP methyl ester carboxylesterase
MAEWTEKGRLTAGGKSLEYACWGPPPSEAPTLMMLHEGLGSVAQWKGVPERLAKATGFGVVAWSRAGYGQSDPVTLPRPLSYQTNEALGSVGDVIDALGVQQAVLLGHSDGGTIAGIYAGSVSDMRVRGLILIAPHFFTHPAGIAAIAEAGRAYENGDLKQKLAKYHANVDVAFRGWHDTWTNPDYAKWNVADVIDHWRIPVLAIQGAEDPYGSLDTIKAIEERTYSPAETLVLEGCGHTPHVERPEETDAAIVEFCARLERLEKEEVSLA